MCQDLERGTLVRVARTKGYLQFKRIPSSILQLDTRDLVASNGALPRCLSQILMYVAVILLVLRAENPQCV